MLQWQAIRTTDAITHHVCFPSYTSAFNAGRHAHAINSDMGVCVRHRKIDIEEESDNPKHTM